ncbi:MAG: hypothetical protein ACD_62C00267G0005 [uncultured bacterium]|nr:MAG: hypothetical protein ACD_62C00267G0005 [uncultured bacterium]
MSRMVYTEVELLFGVNLHKELFVVGPALRGAFGKSLRRGSCVKDRVAKCPTCELFKNCPYSLVFESHEREGAVPWTPGIVFEWDACDEGVRVVLRVFGNLNEVLDVSVKASAKMKVFVSDQEPPQEPERITVSKPIVLEPTSAHDIPKKIAVKLITPLNLKHDGKQLRNIDLRVLAQTIQRRVDSLQSFFGDGYTSHRTTGDEELGNIVESQLAMHNEQRFSFRQRQSHPLNGLVGSFVVQNPSPKLFSLLKFAEVTHVGKGLSFGQGRIKSSEV